jgi:hypothetical protein
MNLRGATRRWLKNWERVGPMLEAERLAGLQALTDAEAARIACDLWRLARPGGGDRLWPGHGCGTATCGARPSSGRNR